MMIKLGSDFLYLQIPVNGNRQQIKSVNPASLDLEPKMLIALRKARSRTNQDISKGLSILHLPSTFTGWIDDIRGQGGG